MGNKQSSPLMAISPLDGRYLGKCAELAPCFSEFALMRYRVLVEINWLQKLADHPQIEELQLIESSSQARLDKLIKQFSLEDAERIKQIEATTNHDVKAVEYFIKEKLAEDSGLTEHLEFVHFACTSEDINNLAYALMLKQGRDQLRPPKLE